MESDKNAWENFIHTGKIDDYLRYRRAAGIMAEWLPAAEGAVSANATDDKRNSPPGLQNRR